VYDHVLHGCDSTHTIPVPCDVYVMSNLYVMCNVYVICNM